MSKYGSLAQIALPYAEALFEASKLNKLFDSTSQDLKLISDTVSNSQTLRDFLANPLIANQAKKDVLHDLFKNQVSINVFNFLCILIERRRISLLNEIIDSYFNLVYQLESITVANIFSSIVLNDIQKEALENKLKLITNSQKIELTVHIKPELIGGLVVKLGSKVIDMSIAGQLNHMASYLNVSRV